MRTESMIINYLDTQWKGGLSSDWGIGRNVECDKEKDEIVQPWTLLLHIYLSQDIWRARHSNQNLCTPVKQSERRLAKLMSGKKEANSKIRSGFAALFKKELTFNTCHCCCRSQMGTLTSRWEIIEITCLRPRSVERFGERGDGNHVTFFGETNLWGDLHWPGGATPIWCLSAIQMWQPARNPTFRFALPPIALRLGDKCALNETYPCKFAFALPPLSKYEEQQECFKPFHLSYT